MNPTGNPFVDAGLMVLATLAKKDSVAELRHPDIYKIFGDGEQLARDNQALKCFTMVFGTNGPLTQPAYKKSGKNTQIYLSIVRQLLELAGQEGQRGTRCDLTGIQTEFDFHTVCAKALREASLPVPDRKWLGRDWVPLAGSLGNDAQALPVASRPLHVSALALFALQYLPLGVFLFKGKLAFPQSTQEDLSQAWIADVVQNNLDRLRLGQTEILGKGGGTGRALDLLMRCFEDISYSSGNEVLLWLFSNSGTGPDCETELIPDFALSFVCRAAATFGSEIRSLIAHESKDPRYQLFECIRAGRDYWGLYPYKNQPGASAEFYEFYQVEIRGAKAAALGIARKLAKLIQAAAVAKEQKEIRKPEFLRAPNGKSLVRKSIIAYLTPDEYDILFPSERHPIRTQSAGWEYLRFYLSTQKEDKRATSTTGSVMKTTHPKIIQIAETYRHVEQRKIKSLLDRMAQRKIGVRWLQDKFCRLAEEHEDWNLGEWDELACDEEGKVNAFELMFQLRLYLSNLYRELTSNGKGEAA
jgi:hypothetical protein